MKNLKKIVVKGKITPHTPAFAYRHILCDDVRLKDGERLIVNDRCCKIGWRTDGGYFVYPIDKPLPPKNGALRKSEQLADNEFIEFCKSGDWRTLLNKWEICGRFLFRERLLKQLNERFPIKKNCDVCDLKFKCYTQS
jgi:hypothetical protein